MKANIQRIKIVLTGGGTRGIYQIGAVKAIKELGLWDNVVSISAASIGAINAVLLTQYNVNEAYQLWMSLSKQEMFKNIDQYASTYLIQMAKQSIMDDGIDFNPFINNLYKHINERKVRACSKELIMTMFNQVTNQQEYYSLNEIPEGSLIDHLAASSRLPFFKPVFINGHKYVDGGIGDNHPYFSKLNNTHFDIVICIKIGYVPFFIPNKRIRNISFDNECIIKPSGAIGTPLEFKNPSFEQKYEMGYNDAKEALKLVF